MDAIDTDTPDERERVLAPEPVPDVDTPDAADDADDDDEETDEDDEEAPAEIESPETTVISTPSARKPA
jgi:hypothetical protein